MNLARQWRSHPRRDRRGRGLKKDLIPSHLPGYRSRRDRFDACVFAAMSPLYSRYGQRLEHVEVLVEEVPGPRALTAAHGPIVLGRYFPGDRHTPPRIVLYRRPIESRAEDSSELAELVRHIIIDHVAVVLGCRPEDIDPHFA